MKEDKISKDCKKKKLLNVFRTSATALVLAGMMLTSTFMIGGCSSGKDSANGKDGTNGVDGATWYSGEQDPTTSLGKRGDFYFETDDGDIWQYTEDGWVVIANMKGPQGEDGTNAYVGYDGYIWNGPNRTNFVGANFEENVAENTLELYDNKYFAKDTIEAGTKVALMANHFKHINCTQYSGLTINELTTYVSGAGKLDIGVINLDTKAYTLKQTVDVVAGKNTIALNIEAGTNETFVLGGDTTTVDLYKATGVNAQDEYGLFTNDLTNLTLSQTGNINDKLIVNVRTSIVAHETRLILENINTDHPQSDVVTPVVLSYAPFAYIDGDSFAGKRIDSIGCYIDSVTESAEEYYMSVYKIKIADIEKGHYADNNTAIKVVFDKEDLKDVGTVNKLVYGTCDIQLAEDETLAFGASSGDTIVWRYNKSLNQKNAYNFYMNNATKGAGNLVFDCRYTELVTYDTKQARIEHLQKLENLDKEAYVKAQLAGKNLSVLGDSISTYAGVSNDGNESLNNNAVYYSSQINQADTYWQQILTKYGMNLCVNNSWSGSYVSQHRPNQNYNIDGDGSLSCGMARANKLAKQDGTTPDYILIYIGINDLNAGVSAQTVAAAYNEMLNTVTSEYADAKVFCVNMPNRNGTNSPLAYNAAIKSAVDSHENVYLIDLYNSEFSGEVYNTNSLGDNLHPNAIGMDYMTEVIIAGMREVVLANYNK